MTSFLLADEVVLCEGEVFEVGRDVAVARDHFAALTI